MKRKWFEFLSTKTKYQNDPRVKTIINAATTRGIAILRYFLFAINCEKFIETYPEKYLLLSNTISYSKTLMSNGH